MLRRNAILGLVAAALAVSACTGARPLYGTTSSGESVASSLAGVTVEEQKSRAGQLVRNELISLLGRGGESAYVLRLTPEEKTTIVSSIIGQNLTRKRYRLKVTYELIPVGGKDAALQGSSFSNVSFDEVQEPIADLRAAENAMERAAREVAEDIRLRLAAAMAGRG